MSDSSLPKAGTRYNCPACGAVASVPEESLLRFPSPMPHKLVVYVQGTCEKCRSTDTQWTEDLDRNRIERH